ncbi:MAG: ROK family protein [Bacteroidota bacterium]|nr:MAG: ROK family protein [Bacteroidota bacterium]
MKIVEVLGIDVGGSAVKGAPVDTKGGSLLQDRYRIATPIPVSPQQLAEHVNQIAQYFNWKGPIGVGFPAVVLNGVVKTASNIDKSWIGTNAQQLFTKVTGCPTVVVNDADAAGMAEMRFGEGQKIKGTVLLLTIGTGIGSALFTNGKLVSNTEMGHVFLNNGLVAEKFAADSVRQAEELDWEAWSERLNVYLTEMEKLFWPELIIIGGGVSKKPEKFLPAIHIKTPVVMAKQRNEAGIVGAAVAAKKQFKKVDIS